MVAQSQSNMVICPNCKGLGSRQKERGLENKDGSVHTREVIVRCLACLGEGVVAAERVCSLCGEWQASCSCLPGPRHKEFAKLLEPRPKRTIVRIEEKLIGEAADLRSAQCEINETQGDVNFTTSLPQKIGGGNHASVEETAERAATEASAVQGLGHSTVRASSVVGQPVALRTVCRVRD
jgi:hypothetical protein